MNLSGRAQTILIGVLLVVAVIGYVALSLAGKDIPANAILTVCLVPAAGLILNRRTTEAKDEIVQHLQNGTVTEAVKKALLHPMIVDQQERMTKVAVQDALHPVKTTIDRIDRKVSK